MTSAAEQFETQLRASVTITVPNTVPNTVPTIVFNRGRSLFARVLPGLVPQQMKESYGRDLAFVKT